MKTSVRLNQSLSNLPVSDPPSPGITPPALRADFERALKVALMSPAIDPAVECEGEAWLEPLLPLPAPPLPPLIFLPSLFLCVRAC